MFTHRFGVCDVKLWEAADIDQLDSALEKINSRLALLEEVIAKLGDKAEPVEPAKIDLSKMVPGQHAKNRSGNLVYFLAAYIRQEPIRYVFVNDIGGYFDCDVDGKHATDRDYDIVEIIPLDGE